MSDSNPDPNDPRGGRPPQQQPNMKMSRGIFGWVVFCLFALMLLMLLKQNLGNAATISISQLERMLEAGEVKHLVIRDDAIEGERHELPDDQAGTSRKFTVPFPPSSIDSELVNRYRKMMPTGSEVEYNPSSTLLLEALVMYLPWLMIFAFLWFFVLRPMRNAGGGAGMLGNFGRSRHRVTTKEHTHVTFDDVAGIEEAKEEVTEIIEFLRNPRKFQQIGGRIPRGVLLLGEPGCGKTLLAKAIAGEADVPFFSISGSDFVEMFVGVGASRVRDLFKQAKENSPCIIFLDEIDAVGRRRGSGVSSGGHDEREQTLNAILVEMDGFETNDQVIVIAATNRVDVLDPALIRPGRFDRQVNVPMPDVKGRFEILKVHSRKVKMGPDIDLQRMARATPGFSGADLAAVINEAALRATLENKDYVEMEDLEESRDKVRWGRARKNRAIEEKERVATAYHEMGHALVQILLAPAADPVHKVSILPRGPYLGATFTLPEQDRLSHSRKWMLAQLRILCAGRIAEESFRDDVNSGVAQDIRQASQIARMMITQFGMNDELGFVFYGDEENENYFSPTRSYSDDTARRIDEAVKRLMDEAYIDAKRLLTENHEKLEELSQALLKYETLDGDEVIALMRGEQISRPTIGDLLDEDRSAPSAHVKDPVSDPENEPPPLGGALPQPG